MELLGVLAALAALFLLCVFLSLKGGLHSALAPLAALGLIDCWLTACGMGKLLLPGVVLLLAACAALGVWALATERGSIRGRLCTPGAVLFWALCLVFAVYFSVRRPLATGFDELNLWATAVRITTVDNRLYPFATLGTPWAVTQNPGLPLLGYFFNFFGTYADWKVFLAYDVLAFAVYAAVLGGVEWKRYRLAVPLAAICWCVPWFFTTYNHTIYLNTVYLTSYGDIPAGLVLGGAVALWLMLRRTGGPKWAVLPVLAMAANLKANTFVLALVAAGLVAVDSWLFPQQTPFYRGILRRTGFSVLCMAAPMTIYYFWNVRFVGVITAQNAAEGGMGETTASLSQVVVNGIKILLGRPVEGFFEERRPQFLQAMADMGTQYWTRAGTLSMIGQGVIVTGLILCLFFGAWLVGGRLQLRLRVLTTAVLSLICFGGYNLMLALSYGFIFKPFQAESLVDYNRYIYSYYIGWFLIALAFVSLALQPGCEAQRALCADPDGPTAVFRTVSERPRLAMLGELAVLVIAAGMLWRTNSMVLPQLSVLGFSDSEFADRRMQQSRAAQVSKLLDPSDRVFYVHQGENGLDWFTATYDLYPVIVDKSGDDTKNCGGTFGLEELRPEEEGAKRYYYHPFTAEELDAVVRGNGCTVLYLDEIDEIFVQSYAGLFTDGLAAAQNGSTLLYRVEETGFAPVEMEAVG